MNERTSQERQTTARPDARTDERGYLYGPLPRLQGVRAVLRALVPAALLAILPLLWTGAAVDVLAQPLPINQIQPGPAGETYSTYWYQIRYDPVFGPPCNDEVVGLALAQFVGSPGDKLSITCAHDEPPTLVRYVALIQGTRCKVTWRGQTLERRPCVFFPVAGNER